MSLVLVGVGLDANVVFLASAAIMTFVMYVCYRSFILALSADSTDRQCNMHPDRSFAIGLGPVPFVIIPEVSPSHVRSTDECPRSGCTMLYTNKCRPDLSLPRPLALCLPSLCHSTVSRPMLSLSTSFPLSSHSIMSWISRDRQLLRRPCVPSPPERAIWRRLGEGRKSVLRVRCHIGSHCDWDV